MKYVLPLVLLGTFLLGAGFGGVYGHRIDKNGARIRWLTVIDAEQGVEIETERGPVQVFRVPGDKVIIRVHAVSTNVSFSFAAPNVAEVELR